MGYSMQSTFELWLLISVIFVLRYALLAGIPFLIFYGWRKKQGPSVKLQNVYPGWKQIRREIGYSVMTLAIYGLGIYIFIYWLDAGQTAYYAGFSDYGPWYAMLSFVAMVFIHDTYFYWTHRLIHHKWLFRHIHLTHHQFTNPTPWSAFSFHPFEALLSMGVIPIIVFLIPWHHTTLITFITFMTLYDVYIHLGFEIKGVNWLKWQNTATDHDFHHRYSGGNFGLYFTLWDRIMGTYKYSSNKTTTA